MESVEPLQEWETTLDELAADAESEDAGVDEFRFRHSDTVLFETDLGTLTFEARSVLTAVLKRNYLSADQHPKLWAALVKHRHDVESRLNDLFLMLVCDTDAGIAYKAQVPGSKFPTLLATQNRAYTWTETILLRHLREMYSQEKGRDGSSQVVISKKEMIERLEGDKSVQRNNEKGQRDAAVKAFEVMESTRILISVNDSAKDRYRISPVIEPLVSVDKLRALNDYLDSLDAEDAAQDGDGTTPHPYGFNGEGGAR